MKNLKERLRKQGGFTLIEMLIVVAIIAILIAIAIPSVGSSLDAARKATDDANMRAAIGVGYIAYMSDGDLSKGEYYKIDGGSGTLVGSTDKGSGYNQLKQGDIEIKKGVIKLSIVDGAITGEWVSAT